MGAIKQSDVAALKQPFTEMQLVQAVGKIHEYQSIVEEAESLFYKEDELTAKEKEDLFIRCLQKKITSLYETMTPVPWKKSCRWRSTDLFIGSNLVMTDKKAALDGGTKLTDIRMEYTEIFSHEKLASENRIILEGDPGSGKTMLMSQLAYDWCQGKLTDIEVFILLPLKFVEEKTIVQAIKEFYFPQNDRLSLSDIEYFLLHGGMSKCLLLDGLEKSNPTVTMKEESEVVKVMTGLKYPTCKVVVSLRTDYAQNLPECARLKLAKLNDVERNSYIERVFADSLEQQNEVRFIIKDNPFIWDLCSIPLMFVFTVHNIECMVKLASAGTCKVTPFVKSVVNDLGATGSVGKTGESDFGREIMDMRVLEELAYNGLCRGHQQLCWSKEFIESNVRSIREWIDSGILVMEENVAALPLVRNTAYEKHDASIAKQEEDSGSLLSEAATEEQTDTGSEVKSATKPDSSEVQIKTNHGCSTTAIYVPLQVKFAHKMFQEWFAARHLSSVISRLRNADYLQRYLAETLLHINPSDLRFLLYFVVALYPPCCHIILKHLLCSDRTQDDKFQKHIMDCIFLCFNEYNGEYGHDILQTVADVCKEDIAVHSGDSRLVHQAKASMLELASNSGIKSRKLVLADVVVSATEDTLTFNSGVLLRVLNTLEVLEIIDSDGNWTKEDCANVLKFIENCAWIKMACLNVSQHPPLVDKEVAVCLQESGKTGKVYGVEKYHPLLQYEEDEIEDNLPVTETETVTDSGWGEELILEAAETISSKGGSVEIPDTGVKMDIPTHALPEVVDQCNICMKIIPPDVSDWSVTDLVSNSSVVVELLPNNLSFQQPFTLTLPHCLQLKKGVQHKAKIFVSHHEEGTYPRWEEKTDALYELTDKTCTIWLNSFCWVKYVIDGKTVEAQRVQVFAGGRHMLPSDTVYETEVGFFPDTPGGGEEIPFEFIDESKESSCPFIFAKQSDKPLIPRFMFRAAQGDRGVRLLYRPKADLFSYRHLKEKLASILLKEDCMKLCTFFALSESQKDTIVNNEKPAESLLIALEGKGVLLPNNVHNMIDAFHKLKIDSFCSEIVKIYQNTREKEDLFIRCLQKKIKICYETMSPVPWKNSCKWKAADLFVETTLTLTNVKIEKSRAPNTEECELLYREIFTHDRIKAETRILLEGDPGAGKTLLMYQLAYEWSQGKFKNIKILILLPLTVLEGMNLTQAIKHFYIPDDNRLSVTDIEIFLSRERNSKCLLLDGWEEYNSKVKEGEQSEVMKIMSKLKYPTCKTVLSSRSHDAKTLPQFPVLKLSKFGKVERNAYIQKAFPNNFTKQTDARSLTVDNQLIYDLCSLPLLFVMVVHNIESARNLQLAKMDRVTPIVNSVVDALCPVSSAVSKAEEPCLPVRDENEKDMSLEQLAYDGLCTEKQQFHWQREFIESKLGDSKRWIDSGILVMEEIIADIKRLGKSLSSDLLGGGTKLNDDVEAEEEENTSSVMVEAVAELQTHTGNEVKSITGLLTEVQPQNTQSSSTATSVLPLQVKFFHKIIQEWFAAKYLSVSVATRFRNSYFLQGHLKENLLLVNPFDLRYVLRFAVALSPTCCHIVIKHLLNKYRSDNGDLPKHVMDYIFLCFAEYNGGRRHDMLEAVADICKEDIVINSEDTRVLQQAKVDILNFPKQPPRVDDETAISLQESRKTGTYPRWEKQTSMPYELTDTICRVLQLNSFCWVKCVIDDDIVETQRIQVYAVGRYMLPKQRAYEIKVGYFPDMPGGGEEIPFEFIDLFKERCCSFKFVNYSEDPLTPVFIFKAVQGNKGVCLRYHTKVREDVSEGTQTT
ncbi:Protein NLRC5 [Holothuria leucospilota]|uniref:Protein NLRC5 n=1 Tax=Holothuria leucospilota TaxID=206669 RepID=A0A9Q1H6Y1_HOLLE|nr:Protein NLRC5 [Holothuria leucospilota]